MQFLSIFSIEWLALITAGLFLLPTFLGAKSQSTSRKATLGLRNAAPYICAVLLGITPVFIASIHMPYPLFGLNFDLPRSISQPVDRVLETDYLVLSARAPEVLLVSLSSFLYNVTALEVLWSSRFLLGSVLSLGVFLFVKEITETETIALLAALLAPLLMVGSLDPTWSPFFDTPAQHFRSNTILQAIFPYTLLIVYRAIGKTREKVQLNLNKVMLAVLSFFFAFFAYSIIPENTLLELPPFYKLLRIDPILLPILFSGLVLVSLFYFSSLNPQEAQILLLLFWTVMSFSIIHRQESLYFVLMLSLFAILIHSSWRPKQIKVCRSISVITLCTGFILVSLALLVKPDITVLGFEISHYSFEYIKLRDFWFGNGQIVVVVSLIGAIGLAVKSQSRMEIMMSLLFSATLFLFFAPIIWTYRLFKQLAVLMAYVVAVTLGYVLHWGLRQKLKRVMIKLGFAAFMTMLIANSSIPIWHRFAYRSSLIPEQNWQSFNTTEEIVIAEFIRRNTPPDSVIISDYFTMYTLTPLSNRIWAIEKFMGPESLGFEERLGRIKHEVLLARNSSSAYGSAMQLSLSLSFDELDYIERTQADIELPNIIIVITPRTNSWVHQEDLGFSLALSTPVDPYVLRIFNEQRYFRMIFSASDHYVYEARHSPTTDENKPDQALRFLDYSTVKIQKSEDSYFSPPFTVELFFNPEEEQGNKQGNSGDLVSKETNFQVKVLNGSKSMVVTYFAADKWQTLHSSFPSSLAHSWHHLAVVFDREDNRTEVAIYLDGQIINEETLEGSPLKSYSPLFIGSFGLTSGVEQYQGLINVVRIYNFALTAEDIQQNSENIYLPITGELYLWFDMNTNTSDLVFDLSHEKHHGTVIGAKWEELSN